MKQLRNDYFTHLHLILGTKLKGISAVHLAVDVHVTGIVPLPPGDKMDSNKQWLYLLPGNVGTPIKQQRALFEGQMWGTTVPLLEVVL